MDAAYRARKGGLRMLPPIDANVEAKPQMDKALMSEIPYNRRVKVAGKEFVGERREVYLLEERPGEESPYERRLGDAMIASNGKPIPEEAFE